MTFSSFKFLGALLGSVLLLPNLAAAEDKVASSEAAQADWSYFNQTGPAHWGDLAPENILCKIGKNQSPVNVNKSKQVVKPKPIKFDYSMVIPGNMVNTGNGLELNITSGGSIKVDKKDFALKKVSFHSPSEHKVDGVMYPLEAQFLHESDDNEITIVSLLYQPLMGPGPGNAALDLLIKSMPMTVGEANRPGVRDFSLFETRKEVKEYFRYNGSLTTPPCSEGVRWIILKNLPSISRNQMAAFQKALKQPNSRPEQPHNARILLR